MAQAPSAIVFGQHAEHRKAERLDEIRRWRQAHQPLGMPSAGSSFRNPPDDSAGRLIDSLGLKGSREGGASVSEKHANFLVNDQQGTASDVRRLGERVRAIVDRETGVRLEWEVPGRGQWRVARIDRIRGDGRSTPSWLCDQLDGHRARWRQRELWDGSPGKSDRLRVSLRT